MIERGWVPTVFINKYRGRAKKILAWQIKHELLLPDDLFCFIPDGRIFASEDRLCSSSGAVLSIIRVTSSNVRAQPLPRTTHCPHIKHVQLSCDTIFLKYVCGLRFVCPGPLAGSIGPSSHLHSPIHSL